MFGVLSHKYVPTLCYTAGRPHEKTRGKSKTATRDKKCSETRHSPWEAVTAGPILLSVTNPLFHHTHERYTGKIAELGATNRSLMLESKGLFPLAHNPEAPAPPINHRHSPSERGAGCSLDPAGALPSLGADSHGARGLPGLWGGHGGKMPPCSHAGTTAFGHLHSVILCLYWRSWFVSLAERCPIF